MVNRRLEVGWDDDDERIRNEWAESLDDYMKAWVDPQTGAKGMTRKELAHRLDSLGHEVTQQAISLWLSGKTAPRPSMQVAIGRVFGAPARSIFPLNLPSNDGASGGAAA